MAQDRRVNVKFWSVGVIFLAAVAVVTTLGLTPRGQHERLGVILLHGKFGTPNDRKSGLTFIARNLESMGHLVAVPQMPWGEDWEKVAQGVPEVLETIDGLAAALRAAGAGRIVIGGHSMGANVALTYAVTRGNVAGLVMVAPGHRPNDLVLSDERVRIAIAEAQMLDRAGRGDEPFSGPDVPWGEQIMLMTRAGTYFSWMDPQGLAAMNVQAPRLASSIPLLMVVGRRDSYFERAEAAVYKPAARHPYSRYLPVGADHSMTAMAASTPIVQWIDGLPSAATN